MGLCLVVEVFRVTECLMHLIHCVCRSLCWVRCLSTRLLRSRRSKASKRSSTVSATVATMLPSRWPLTASLDWLTPAQVSERVESMIHSVTPPGESAAFCQRQHPVVCFSSLSVSSAVISSLGSWLTDGQTYRWELYASQVEWLAVRKAAQAKLHRCLRRVSFSRSPELKRALR